MDVRAAIVVAVLGVCAVGLGGLLTKLVFRSVDRHDGVAAAAAAAEILMASDVNAPGGATVAGASVTGAGSVLRGGAWIGALERLAIYAGLVASWPEAIAVVLAVKGLGRYPELRSGDTPAVAERFIIGTFVSVLWACGCAGLALWLRG